MLFDHVNILAVLVAAVVAFALGFPWYSVFFGKAWQKQLGFTEEYLKEGNMGLIFGSSFLLNIVMATGMSLLFSMHFADHMSWSAGLHYGFFIGLFFVGTSMGVNYLYQRRSFKLWAIDAGYQILFLAVMGMILGAWM